MSSKNLAVTEMYLKIDGAYDSHLKLDEEMLLISTDIQELKMNPDNIKIITAKKIIL